MASSRGDIFMQNDFEGKNNDKLRTACFAAFSAALATVNFGYALGFTAEAELSKQFSPDSAMEISTINGTSSSKRFAMCQEDFDIFAVSFFFLFIKQVFPSFYRRRFSKYFLRSTSIGDLYIKLKLF